MIPKGRFDTGNQSWCSINAGIPIDGGGGKDGARIFKPAFSILHKLPHSHILLFWTDRVVCSSSFESLLASYLRAITYRRRCLVGQPKSQ